MNNVIYYFNAFSISAPLQSPTSTWCFHSVSCYPQFLMLPILCTYSHLKDSCFPSCQLPMRQDIDSLKNATPPRETLPPIISNYDLRETKRGNKIW